MSFHFSFFSFIVFGGRKNVLTVNVTVEGGNKVLIMERRPTKSRFTSLHFQEEINLAKERESRDNSNGRKDT